jgi:DNA-directed RNA polymerase subunit M/transcription elongation factor TFIIS
MPSNVATTQNEVRHQRLCPPGPDRPTYDCPQCGEHHMQFFRSLPEKSQSAERTDCFVCFACGRSWQM